MPPRPTNCPKEGIYGSHNRLLVLKAVMRCKGFSEQENAFPTGVERSSKSSEDSTIAQPSGAQSGALADGSNKELAEVVEAWLTLPGDAQAQILQIVRDLPI